MNDRLTRAERIGLLAFAIACVLFGFVYVPPSGVFCAGDTAVTGRQPLEGCQEARERIGAKCDVRWPRCYWQTYHAGR